MLAAPTEPLCRPSISSVLSAAPDPGDAKSKQIVSSAENNRKRLVRIRQNDASPLWVLYDAFRMMPPRIKRVHRLPYTRLHLMIQKRTPVVQGILSENNPLSPNSLFGKPLQSPCPDLFQVPKNLRNICLSGHTSTESLISKSHALRFAEVVGDGDDLGLGELLQAAYLMADREGVNCR